MQQLTKAESFTETKDGITFDISTSPTNGGVIVNIKVQENSKQKFDSLRNKNDLTYLKNLARQKAFALNSNAHLVTPTTEDYYEWQGQFDFT